MTFNFFSSKKAQGMSLNIIIVAVILIAILVIILILVGSKTKIFSKSLASCESKGPGARCITDSEECDGILHRIGTDCSTNENSVGSRCCVPVGG